MLRCQNGLGGELSPYSCSYNATVSTSLPQRRGWVGSDDSDDNVYYLDFTSSSGTTVSNTTITHNASSSCSIVLPVLIQNTSKYLDFWKLCQELHQYKLPTQTRTRRIIRRLGRPALHHKQKRRNRLQKGL